ncbi:MAG: PKD domain-containing protein [Cytophagales bacterium]|nr:PKD domain-containing protein [Bernardetiaceae bacterium]MDW8210710.1 PKD domain-containing protein [Cytophagales bacterium]
MRPLIGIVIVGIVAVSCAREGVPFADFSVEPNPATVGKPVTFVNRTINATEFEWYVQGNLVSNQQEPSYIFTSSGTFVVTLVARNPKGVSGGSIRVQVLDPRDSLVGTYRGTVTVTLPDGRQGTGNSTCFIQHAFFNPLGLDITLTGINDAPPRNAIVVDSHNFNIQNDIAGVQMRGTGVRNGRQLMMNYTVRSASNNQLLATYRFVGSK